MTRRNLTLLVAALLPTGGCAPRTGAPAALAAADSVVAAWTSAERVPGAVLLVARDGRVVHRRAFGYARLYELRDGRVERLAEPEPMTPEHLFDLASVTKVMGTTFAVMMLVDRGAVELDAPLYRYLPAFRGPHRDSITVRHLLTHTSGLPQWEPVYYHASDEAGAYAHIRTLPLTWGVGEGRHYSDLGFMLLGYMVERVSGRPLDAFLHDELYAPLGLEHTSFNPKDRGLGPFAATSHGNPFEKRMVADASFGYVCDEDPAAFTGWRDYTLAGEVNDGNAWYAHHGVAGHAGLFSTADDLAVLLDLLMNEGEHDGRRFIDAGVIREFLRPQATGNGLGWGMTAATTLMDDPPAGTFAHTGFTGTFVAGVPAEGLAVVLLTNRQNGGVDRDGGYPDVGPLRRDVLRALRRDGAPR